MHLPRGVTQIPGWWRHASSRAQTDHGGFSAQVQLSNLTIVNVCVAAPVALGYTFWTGTPLGLFTATSARQSLAYKATTLHLPLFDVSRRSLSNGVWAQPQRECHIIALGWWVVQAEPWLLVRAQIRFLIHVIGMQRCPWPSGARFFAAPALPHGHMRALGVPMQLRRSSPGRGGKRRGAGGGLLALPVHACECAVRAAFVAAAIWPDTRVSFAWANSSGLSVVRGAAPAYSVEDITFRVRALCLFLHP